ncbi:PilZ domain-containing protein [Aurantiacibacter spongiae]|uniref:PilZ domain-containing protein n=1 Tax=Aurantiacibacter spongiae TaxID=2488860 RepID=A0A3N5DIU4_9SPHN|nr:PilZ domain-containing protein [Aurantiacibacter spongiae]RPF70565.1 PilZ domain-containing protein [Aurantiacibacter spongiae]
MSVLTIRSHRRYAMRLPVEVERDGGSNTSGLLIELSQQGARISNLRDADYVAGEQVWIQTADDTALEGTVRWAHDGLAGVRLNRSLHLPELRDLLEANRREVESVELQYGT